ncbi:hypothetical protein ACFLZX_03365 [Nanoarchaeota archaeon]
MPFDKGIPTPTAYIRYKGVWSMNELYENMATWFRTRKYNVYEKTYKHKAPSPFGKDRQYEWTAFKNIDDYNKVNIYVYMHCYDVSDFEVVVKGKKKIFTKGRIWILIKLDVEFDQEKKFNESKFYSHLKDFYNKYVLRKRVMQGLHPKYRTVLWRLHHNIQTSLNMQTKEFEHIQVSGGHVQSA